MFVQDKTFHHGFIMYRDGSNQIREQELQTFVRPEFFICLLMTQMTESTIGTVTQLLSFIKHKYTTESYRSYTNCLKPYACHI
jgi:hypothetical protein